MFDKTLNMKDVTELRDLINILNHIKDTTKNNEEDKSDNFALSVIDESIPNTGKVYETKKSFFRREKLV